ncbi:unnamed protein product [Amoebophrya sp. A120]|nr:unnamed protein product [Amoebophrya sp. A120]|eukprot:GSA120T00018018001.1
MLAHQQQLEAAQDEIAQNHPSQRGGSRCSCLYHFRTFWRELRPRFGARPSGGRADTGIHTNGNIQLSTQSHPHRGAERVSDVRNVTNTVTTRSCVVSSSEREGQHYRDASIAENHQSASNISDQRSPGAASVSSSAATAPVSMRNFRRDFVLRLQLARDRGPEEEKEESGVVMSNANDQMALLAPVTSPASSTSRCTGTNGGEEDDEVGENKSCSSSSSILGQSTTAATSQWSFSEGSSQGCVDDDSFLIHTNRECSSSQTPALKPRGLAPAVTVALPSSDRKLVQEKTTSSACRKKSIGDISSHSGVLSSWSESKHSRTSGGAPGAPVISENQFTSSQAVPLSRSAATCKVRGHNSVASSRAVAARKTRREPLLRRCSVPSTVTPHARPEDFIVLRQVGKGSFGEVYLVQEKRERAGDITRIPAASRASNSSSNCALPSSSSSALRPRYFAMKVLTKERICRRGLLRYAITERNVLSFVTNHPFIIQLHYAFQTPTKLVLCLEYCNGGNMQHLLQKLKRFPECLARIYTAQQLLALEFLHERNILYRDMKPENIVLDARGHSYLTDFGLSLQLNYTTGSSYLAAAAADAEAIHVPAVKADGAAFSSGGRGHDFHSSPTSEWHSQAPSPADSTSTLPSPTATSTPVATSVEDEQLLPTRTTTTNGVANAPSARPPATVQAVQCGQPLALPQEQKISQPQEKREKQSAQKGTTTSKKQLGESFCGSVAYLAPEMLQRRGHGHTLDTYGLGVLLFEMLSGTPPFYTRDRRRLFRNILEKPIDVLLSASFIVEEDGVANTAAANQADGTSTSSARPPACEKTTHDGGPGRTSKKRSSTSHPILYEAKPTQRASVRGPPGVKISPNAKTFLRHLLQKRPKDRLGARRTSDIRADAFFGDLDWNWISEKEKYIPVPMLAKLLEHERSTGDVQVNFENMRKEGAGAGRGGQHLAHGTSHDDEHHSHCSDHRTAANLDIFRDCAAMRERCDHEQEDTGHEVHRVVRGWEYTRPKRREAALGLCMYN